MAYVPPVVDASAQTWAQLQSRGFSGHVKALVAALSTNPATFAANQALGMLLDANKADLPIERARNLVDNYTSGKSDKASTKLALYDIQLVFASLAAATGEMAVLVDAN